jgi:hypothetical protein
MSAEQQPRGSGRMADAIAELKVRILQEYPDAIFTVTQSEDDPQVTHVRATVDVEDPDTVLDLVLDRMMALQIEEDLPIFVIPVRPPGRVVEALRHRASQQPPAALPTVVSDQP